MLNRKPSRMMKTGIILLAVLALGVIGYTAKSVMSNQLSPSSPQYVVSHAIDTYKQHDATAFSKYVDINAVSASVNTSWHDYRKNSFNRAFTSCPANSEPTFNKYINQLVSGQVKLEQQNEKNNIGVAYILLNISDYTITNIKNITDDSKSFDLVAKSVGNSSIVIPMTIKKSGDDWKISAINVTNLFVAYDNEIKRQEIEFNKVLNSHPEFKNIAPALKRKKIDIGPFTISTYEQASKKLDIADKELNEILKAANDGIDLFNTVPDTNEVGKIEKFYILNILKYEADKAKIQLYVVENVNKAYKGHMGNNNGNQDITASDFYFDGYMDAKDKISKLGYIDGSYSKIRAIDDMLK